SENIFEVCGADLGQFFYKNTSGNILGLQVVRVVRVLRVIFIRRARNVRVTFWGIRLAETLKTLITLTPASLPATHTGCRGRGFPSPARCAYRCGYGHIPMSASCL